MTRTPAEATAADLIVGDQFLIPHGTMTLPALVTKIVDNGAGRPRMIFVAPQRSGATNAAQVQYLLEWHQPILRWPAQTRAAMRSALPSSLRPRQRAAYRSLGRKRA